jgi:predicted NBD/HSP70 family sugar kinase
MYLPRAAVTGLKDAALPAAIVACVASGAGNSRADLARTLGISRSTVGAKVDVLITAGLLVERGSGRSKGGRPPQLLALNPRAGVVLAADIGASHARLGVADLNGTILTETEERLDVRRGPEEVLGRVSTMLTHLLTDLGQRPDDVVALGIGLPGPVDHSTGAAVRPPIMLGWDGFPIPDFFATRYDAEVLVDNDVNLMALGEHHARGGKDDHLLFVKVGTGIGCGIISQGRLHRGAAGAAGDIGHIRLAEHEETICHCGNVGCVEAVASGSALVRQLADTDETISSPADVVRLVLSGHATARHAVRLASERIGEVLAGIVSFHNPQVIVVGGALAMLDNDLLAGMRSVIYRRALPLATRSLRIETSKLGVSAGMVGAAVLARNAALSPDQLTRWLNRAETKT